MRWAVALLSLAACTHVATVSPAPPRALQPGDPCGTEAPVRAASSDGEALEGAIVEKVCLLGLPDDLVQHFEDRLSSRAGAALDADAVQADIEQIHFTGQARDVTALALPFDGEPKRVRLIFEVQTYPVVDELVVDGASEGDAAAISGHFERGIAASPAFSSAYANVARFAFLEAGYLDGKVEPRFEPLPSGSIRLRLLVTPGLRRVVTAVRFDGASSVPQADLAAAMADLIGGPYVQHVADRRRAKVLSLGYDHGLIEARVTAGFEPKPTEAEPGSVVLVFHLEEGVVYHLAEVKLTGDAFAAPAKALAALRNKPKGVYSRAALDEDEQQLKALGKRGGFAVETHRQVEFHVENKTVDIVFSARRAK